MIERLETPMEEKKEMQFAGEKVTMTDDEHDEILNELREFRELENMKVFLQTENAELKSEIEFLTGELEGINIAVTTAEKDMASSEVKTKKCSKSIEKF